MDAEQKNCAGSNFPCADGWCKHVSKTSDAAIRHARTHAGQVEFRCGVCEKNFTTNEMYRVHCIRLHESPPACPCMWCAYAAIDSTDALEHEITHVNYIQPGF